MFTCFTSLLGLYFYDLSGLIWKFYVYGFVIVSVRLSCMLVILFLGKLSIETYLGQYAALIESCLGECEMLIHSFTKTSIKIDVRSLCDGYLCYNCETCFFI